MNKFFNPTLFLVGLLLLAACKKDDTPTPTPTPTPPEPDPPAVTTQNITVDISGLEALGDNFAYEGWLLVNGAPVSAGVFDVAADGSLSTNTFVVNISDAASATAYVLTIEPKPDTDPQPTDTHLLAGDFSGNTANLRLEHMAALGDNFTTASGDFILATPTDGSSITHETSGVWWFDPATATATLALPVLPPGWKYEGWAVIDGTPVTTGTFTSTTGKDDAAPYSGTAAPGPNYPGEDFLMNAPMGLTFPTDLSSKTIVVSVEPDPDNAAGPFLLKPLVGMVPAAATDRSRYSMSNNATNTNPIGTVIR